MEKFSGIIGNKKEAQLCIGDKLDISFILDRLTQKKRPKLNPKPGEDPYYENPIFFIPQVLEKAKEYYFSLPDHQKSQVAFKMEFEIEGDRVSSPEEIVR